MKMKSKRMRKKYKRELKKADRGIVDLLHIIFHFFGNLSQWIAEMTDGRHQSYITYTQENLLCMGILKNLCSVESMRQMEEKFNEETCIRTLGILSGNPGLEEMPHSDTLNHYLSKLPPECLEQLRNKMVRELIRGKTFHRGRLLNEYWRVILDGTGLFYFREKHCEHCMKEKHVDESGKKSVRYYHKVLEAKLVLGKGFVISLGTEFIENENEDAQKQDCELNAAKRLMEKIKKAFPRLAICIQADALYEAETVMGQCRDYGWEYLITHKDTRQRTVGKDYGLLGEEKTEVGSVGKESGTGRYYNGMHEISGKKEIMNLFEYEYEKQSEKEMKKIRFNWNTSIEVTGNNINELIEAGRGRWQIENEGFNTQKNILYHIEHLNSKNPTAMKNHYLLTQISDIIMSLYLHWNPIIKQLGQGIKNTSSYILESLRQTKVTDEDVLYIKRRTSVYLE